MSEEIERTLGKIESTMSHFGESLDEAKKMIRGSAEATSALRIEVARGLTQGHERQAAQETETNRRFDVVDDRLDGTHHKIDGVRDDLAAHEKMEIAGSAHGATPSQTAVVGGASAAGAVGLWAILQRVWEWLGTVSQPPGGH